MKILEVKSLAIPDVKVIRFARFPDHRGYFTEHVRHRDFKELDFLSGVDFVQQNESFSRPGVVRGLHFQWEPYIGKLVRTVMGRMVDLFLDIRKGSPSFGCACAYDMPVDYGNPYSEWIWIPPGFAHGNFFTKETVIEYLCTGEYNPATEAGICPSSEDINWSSCPPDLKSEFDCIVTDTQLISDKDRKGLTLGQWEKDKRFENFVYDQLKGCVSVG